MNLVVHSGIKQVLYSVLVLLMQNIIPKDLDHFEVMQFILYVRGEISHSPLSSSCLLKSTRCCYVSGSSIEVATEQLTCKDDS